ncbi:hypothetical protein GX48_04832 [Paracoccidioides brasiliensis]|nr:hypothetical protein GX48_04832 [Paracoccidioides brasiliensis]
MTFQKAGSADVGTFLDILMPILFDIKLTHVCRASPVCGCRFDICKGVYGRLLTHGTYVYYSSNAFRPGSVDLSRQFAFCERRGEPLTDILSVTISLAMLRDLLPLTSDSQIEQHNMISTILEVQMQSSVPASGSCTGQTQLETLTRVQAGANQTTILKFPFLSPGQYGLSKAGKRAAIFVGSNSNSWTVPKVSLAQHNPGSSSVQPGSGDKNRVMTLRQAEAVRYILLDSGLTPICSQDEAVGVNLCPYRARPVQVSSP